MGLWGGVQMSDSRCIWKSFLGCEGRIWDFFCAEIWKIDGLFWVVWGGGSNEWLTAHLWECFWVVGGTNVGLFFGLKFGNLWDFFGLWGGGSNEWLAAHLGLFFGLNFLNFLDFFGVVGGGFKWVTRGAFGTLFWAEFCKFFGLFWVVGGGSNEWLAAHLGLFFGLKLRNFLDFFGVGGGFEWVTRGAFGVVLGWIHLGWAENFRSKRTLKEGFWSWEK